MISVSVMTDDDISQVAAIEADTFSMPWSKKGFSDAVETGNSVFVTAKDGDDVIGYAGVTVACGEGEITQVVVSDKYRRNGIGEALVEALKGEAISREVKLLVLEVRVSNEPAICLYEKMGFTKRGVRKGFYDLPKEDAYIMTLEL
jgi:ribosomal-protein-alanine N-acetyltransferase